MLRGLSDGRKELREEIELRLGKRRGGRRRSCPLRAGVYYKWSRWKVGGEGLAIRWELSGEKPRGERAFLGPAASSAKRSTGYWETEKSVFLGAILPEKSGEKSSKGLS